MLRRRSAGLQSPSTNGSENVRSVSGSKLLDMFRGGPPVLDDALSDIDRAAKLLEKAAEAESRGYLKLWQWARTGTNSAIDDVTSGLKDLQVMHSVEQIRHAQEILRSAEHLRRMQDADKDLKKAEKKVADLKEKEKKMEKEINQMQSSGLFRFKSADAVTVRGHLSDLLQVIRDRERAEDRLKVLRSETEVIKMYRFRNGMKRLADSYCNHSNRLNEIYTCHRELAELVPAVATEDVNYIKYEGAELSRLKVDRVRRSLDPSRPVETTPRSQLLGQSQLRRRSEPLRMGACWERQPPAPPGQGSPPPPYSPRQRFTE